MSTITTTAELSLELSHDKSPGIDPEDIYSVPAAYQS